MKTSTTLAAAGALFAASLGPMPAARAEPAAGLPSLLAQEARVAAASPGLVRLVLPPAVFLSCRPDLSDLRVFDAADRELAFLVDSLRLDEVVEVTESAEGEVLGLRREIAEPERGPGVTTEIYEIAAPARAPESGAWDLVFESAHPRFVREVSVRQSAPGGSAKVGVEGGDETLAAGEPVFRLDGETRRIRLTLPPLGRGTLRVEIVGKEGFYLEPRLRFESGRRIGADERSSVALEEIAREHGEGRTVFELARPSGLVPALLRVETRTGTLRRAVVVFDEQPGSADARIGAGTLHRVSAGHGASNLLLGVRPARGATLRVEIHDGDSPPLDDVRFFAVVRRPALLFELPADAGGRGSATLRFGGGRVRRAHYDLESLLAGVAGPGASGARAEAAAALYDGSWIPLAELGPIRSNPRFDASPALAFAMHPGAAIDLRIFAHRRAIGIEPSPEGLSRVALAPEDAALLRADLADLRVVDSDGRQWPYLVSADARSETVALAVAEMRSERRRTVYRLALPVAPLRIERLTLRTGAPFFDRGFELRAVDEHGRARVAVQGRVVKQALRPGPASIELDDQPVHGLELVVDDGDDAPLAFDEVAAHVGLPELFLVAPAGSYALLLGNPDVPAPRYELERVRDLVLAASSNAATPGPLAANPDYSLGARLRGEDGPSALLQLGLVWGVLLVAVAVLAALTLRVVRQAPAPSPAEPAEEPREG